MLIQEDAEVRPIIQDVGLFGVRDSSDCWVTLFFSRAAIETYEPALFTRLHMMLLW